MTTLSIQPTSDSYTANGATTIFPYTFLALYSVEVTVTSNGVTQVEGTDYTISGLGTIGGGNITFYTAPLNTYAVIISWQINKIRYNDFSQVGSFNADNVNDEFNRLWLALQQSVFVDDVTIGGDLLVEGYATFNTGMDILGDTYITADDKKIIHQGLTIKGANTQATHIDCDGARAFSATATYTDILFGSTKIRLNVAGGVTVTGVLNATSAVLVTPTLTSPVLGVATATSVNKVAITAPATSATLTIADGKTMTASNTLTLSGTDGTALNINAVATLNSGTYTPTLTAIVNVSGSTAYPMQYMRVGNTVTVSGRVDITATGAGVIDLSVSLPIASTLAASYQVAGYGANLSLSTNPATVLGYLATNRALMEGVASGATTYIYFITFTYLVA